jgi:hypothetical protein
MLAFPSLLIATVSHRHRYLPRCSAAGLDIDRCMGQIVQQPSAEASHDQ